jgi:hypothetical protein
MTTHNILFLKDLSYLISSWVQEVDFTLLMQ